MENVIDINKVLAIDIIGELLDLSNRQAQDFYSSLESGKTLAEALREIDIISAHQIGLDRWPKLRAWRDRHFPNNVKFKTNAAG